MKKTRKTPTYLTKFPINISEKKHSKTNRYNGNETHFKGEKSHRFRSRWGYFDVNAKNNVDFIITLTDDKEKINYTIKISKQHIYDSLILFLQYRPILRKKERTKNFYTHDNIKPLIPEEAMNKLTPIEIKERYLNVKKRLGDFIKESPDEKAQRRAELQMERLINQEWKIELLNNIYFSEKLIKTEKT